LRYLKALKGAPQDMMSQVLNKGWVDKTKESALDVVEQYAQYLGIKVRKPNFKAYDNREMYVPNPEMVKTFIYRVRSPSLRSAILIAIETSASASEVWRLTWEDVNLGTKTITIRGVKGHKTKTYDISDELVTLLTRLLKEDRKIFTIKDPDHINDSIDDYRKRLAKETGNSDSIESIG